MIEDEGWVGEVLFFLLIMAIPLFGICLWAIRLRRTLQVFFVCWVSASKMLWSDGVGSVRVACAQNGLDMRYPIEDTLCYLK